ncbi:MAG: TonB-dependent receptor [Flavobacteriales bacterium]
MKRFGLALVLLCFVAVGAFGQGTVRGFLKNKKNAEPAIFVTVGLENTTFGSTSDENGYYSISKIPAGDYTLIVKSTEFVEYSKSIKIENGKVLNLNIELEEKINELGEIEISSEHSDQLNKVNISVESIRLQDIKRIPSIGGQPDLVQVLTTIPGVVSTGDQGGQIFIRGGSPVQNKVLLDGMIVYNPFHSIGIYSVFDSDIIANADIYTGGFSSEYGGRISSVMDITTKDGNKKETKGKFGINPFGVRAMVEGPLSKPSEKGGGISYVLSAKKSYLDQTSKTIYPYVNDGEGLPFQYQDLYGKVSFSGATGSKFNIFGFNFGDAVTNYQGLSNLSWKNTGFGGNFVVVPSNSPVLISGNFSRSEYGIALYEENNQPRTDSITSFNFGLDFKYNIKNDVLKYGIEVVGFSTQYNSYNDLGLIIEERQNTTELNGYFTYRLNRKRWIVEPGIRFQYYASLSVVSPEPRLGVKFKATERLRFKASTGIYSQNLMATNSDRDVVNLFYGFLAGPDNLQSTFTRPNFNEVEVSSPLQKAIHYVAGFEFDITERWNLNMEGYYRDFRQVTNTNRNKIFPDNPENYERPDIQKKDYIVESGWSAGADVVLKYEKKATYLYFVYSLGKVRRWDGYNWYSPVFDRRHNINFVAAQKFGKNNGWEASLRWNLGSGLPFTQTQGFYQGPTTTGGITTNYITANANSLSIEYANLNGGRLPYYHRLDVNDRRDFKFKYFQLEMNIGATNAYNRSNVFYIDRISSRRVDQLPVLPTIGLEMSF